MALISCYCITALQLLFFSLLVQVKSFIETQRGLLADIQNGCKRNFILAKEKEETEQKMRQSASMPEITTEEQAPEDEEDASAEKSEEDNAAVQRDSTEEGNEEDVSESQEVKDQETTVQDDSDSDTEDEEEMVAASSASTQSTSPIPIPAINSCKVMPLAPPLPGSPALISGIKVTEANVSSGAPSSPGRLFSVSSPGRGHKIFMVTRVESPPEQQQATALPKCVLERAVESQTSETPTQIHIKAPLDAPLQAPEQKSTQLAESEPSTLTSHAETTPAPAEVINTSASSLADERENATHSDEVQQQELATPFESQVRLDQTHLEQEVPVNAKTKTSQETSEEDQMFSSHAEQMQESSPTQREPSESGPSPDGTRNPGELPELEVTGGHELLETEGSSAQEGSPEEEEGCPVMSTGIVLPNGLKPEFAFHLLEAEGLKPASCIMEHGELPVDYLIFHVINRLQ